MLGNKNLNFGQAIEALKNGKKVARFGWGRNGRLWLELRIGSADYQIKARNKDVLPWIGLNTVNNGFVPWVALHADMLADDWQIVE